MTAPRKAYLDVLVDALEPERDLLVVGLGANARYWPHMRGRTPSFALCDAMGAAIPLGLGMALARPTRRVVALEGDGSLLMNLGTLATVAAARPRNLTIIVFQNRHYESSGGQALPAVDVDFAALARAVGFPSSEYVADAERFAVVFNRTREAGGLAREPGRPAREAGGPALVVVETMFDPGEAVPPYSERPDEIRLNFARALDG